MLNTFGTMYDKFSMRVFINRLMLYFLLFQSVTSVIIDPLSSRRNFNAKDIVEMTVPTCTYRMGVPRMGYTFLLLGNK